MVRVDLRDFDDCREGRRKVLALLFLKRIDDVDSAGAIQHDEQQDVRRALAVDSRALN
jgi:hypothetical protein